MKLARLYACITNEVQIALLVVARSELHRKIWELYLYQVGMFWLFFLTRFQKNTSSPEKLYIKNMNLLKLFNKLPKPTHAWTSERRQLGSLYWVRCPKSWDLPIHLTPIYTELSVRARQLESSLLFWPRVRGSGLVNKNHTRISIHKSLQQLVRVTSSSSLLLQCNMIGKGTLSTFCRGNRV